MKATYILILVLLSLNTCNSQKKLEIMTPEMTKEFEKFDIKTFNNEVDNISGKRILNNDLFTQEEEKQSFGFVQEIYSKQMFFSVMNLFFENGFIKEKGIYFNNGSQYGIWYEFDEQGNLIKEINTDEGYTFGWKQIIKYCEDNKIELTKGYVQGGYQTNIFKEELNGKKVWVISHLLSPILISKKTLDGITGKLIKEEELEFINH